MISYHIETTQRNRNRNYKKDPNKNPGPGKYNNWNDKFIKRIEQQIWADKKELMNLKTGQLKFSSLKNKN